MKGYTNNAKWIMNTKLSDPSDTILAAQGVGYLKRKAIAMTTVTIVNTHKVENGVIVLTSASSASGIPGAIEVVYLNGETRHADHSVYGKIESTAELRSPKDIPEPYLTAGYTADSYDSDGKQPYIDSRSDKQAGNKLEWTGIVTSGFQEVDVGGKVEKRFCRRMSSQSQIFPS